MTPFVQTFPVNLASVLGANAAFVGFTGGTGDVTSTQTISNFTFTNGGATVPLGIANPVTVAANASSVITSGVSPGFANAGTGALTLLAGSKLALRYTNGGSAARLVLVVPSLTMAGTAAVPTAQFDVGTADVDVQNGSLATLTALAAAGYNGGKFTGQGIVSSAALANPARNTTVGVILNNDPSLGQLYGSGTTLGLFDGSNPSSNDVLVKYTYFGDANLDGRVDGSDYAQIDAGFLSGGALTGWYNGDFNYDGKVDASDFTLIDNAFNTQSVRLFSTVNTPSVVAAASTDEIATVGGTAAVPEPASFALATVAAASLLGRRRRE